MHTIEPYYNWRNLYTAEDDPRSPFFQREYSETHYTDQIYDHYIHPQWDNIDSTTLFVKLLFTHYDEGYCIIELFGDSYFLLGGQLNQVDWRIFTPPNLYRKIESQVAIRIGTI